MHLILAGLLAAASLFTLPKADASFTAGSLHVDRYGSGSSSIVFIPGLSCGPWEWSEQIARFSKTHSVYAITISGFAGTAYTPSSDLFASFQTDFWKLLDDQHITKPIVIGHSLGGTLAFALASSHPDRLQGAIALDGLPVFPALAMSTPSQREDAATKFSAQVLAQSHDQFAASEVTYMKTIGLVDQTLVEPTAALEATSDPKAVAAWMVADLRADLRPQLSSISIPMLELMPYAPGTGYTRDQTLGFYKMLINGAPHGDVQVIDGARHFAMLDQPKAVDAAITQFLATLK